MNDCLFALRAAEVLLDLRAESETKADEWCAALIGAGAEESAESTEPRAPTEAEASVCLEVARSLKTPVVWADQQQLFRRIWEALVPPGSNADSGSDRALHLFERRSPAWQTALGFRSSDPVTDFEGESTGGLAALQWMVWYSEAAAGRAVASVERHMELRRLSQAARGLPWAQTAMVVAAWVCSEFRIFLLSSGQEPGAKRCWALLSSRERFHILVATAFEVGGVPITTAPCPKIVTPVCEAWVGSLCSWSSVTLSEMAPSSSSLKHRSLPRRQDYERH